MFWNRKLKKVEAERDALRAELEEWKECVELCLEDARRAEACAANQSELIARLQADIEEIKGDRETIRCAKHKAEWELLRVRRDLSLAEKNIAFLEECLDKEQIERGYAEHVCARLGFDLNASLD